MRVAALTLLAFVGACAHDVADRYYGDPYPECAPEEVEILANRPKRPFIVIADFQARRTSTNTMRNKAAKIGADAIIVAKVGGYYNPSDTRPDRDSQSASYAHLVATAIKYKDK